MKRLWIGTIPAALLLLAAESMAAAASAPLRVGVTVQRSCVVTRLPAVAAVLVECTRGGGPTPVVLRDEAGLVLQPPPERSPGPRIIQILF